MEASLLNKRRWKRYGILYFALVFALVPALASAYIDPSVTTYAIQAIAGVAVAAGAFFATYGRRMKKSWMKTVGLDENETKETEPPLEITREDLKEKLEAKHKNTENRTAQLKDQSLKGRIITSLLCGFAPALAVILRPVLSLYLPNEREFWFPLSDVILNLLAVFFGAALALALVHFLLPDQKRISLRLLFAAICAAGTLCVFIQNHFLSFYLPILTGKEIDWSSYQGWNILSTVLWGGVFFIFIGLALFRPRVMRLMAYGLLVLLLCTETVTAGVELASASYRNESRSAYFSETGLYETSKAGNVLVIVSDTFEGTYMKMILDQYPEYREILSDITFYDDVTSVSIFTNYSFPTMLTGIDLPLGMNPEDGVSYCYEHQTLLDTVRNNGWEIGYYTTFTAPESVSDQFINYSDEPMHPSPSGRWELTKLLIRNSLFRSAPNLIKKRFMTNDLEYELLKSTRVNADPYVEDDQAFYFRVRDGGLKTTDSAPRYSILELWGVHDPCHFDVNVEYVTFGENVPYKQQKVESGRAQLTILREYLDQLKAAGTYDDTTVIMTADHGNLNRFYPVFLVKEAHRTDEGFRVDHTPLSMKDDFEKLLDAVTAGKKFSDAASALAGESRVRHALDYRAKEWLDAVTQQSFVDVTGPAEDPDSYQYIREDYLLEDEVSGCYKVNTPFGSEGVAYYGCYGNGVYGHSTVYDVFFDAAKERKLTFRASLTNVTDRLQRIRLIVNGEEMPETVTVNPGSDEISVPLPVVNTNRLTLQMYFPDAVCKSTITGEPTGFNDYVSFVLNGAGLYE